MAESSVFLGKVQQAARRFWGLRWSIKGPILGAVGLGILAAIIPGGGDDDEPPQLRVADQEPAQVASPSPAEESTPTPTRTPRNTPTSTPTPEPTATPVPPTPTPVPPTPTPTPRPAQSNVYYRNCDEARAAGAAPIYRGEPGYRPALDRDGDGIACE